MEEANALSKHHQGEAADMKAKLDTANDQMKSLRDQLRSAQAENVKVVDELKNRQEEDKKKRRATEEEYKAKRDSQSELNKLLSENEHLVRDNEDMQKRLSEADNAIKQYVHLLDSFNTLFSTSPYFSLLRGL